MTGTSFLDLVLYKEAKNPIKLFFKKEEAKQWKPIFVLTDLVEIKSSCERSMQAPHQSSRCPGNEADLIQLPLWFFTQLPIYHVKKAEV